MKCFFVSEQFLLGRKAFLFKEMPGAVRQCPPVREAKEPQSHQVTTCATSTTTFRAASGAIFGAAEAPVEDEGRNDETYGH